LISSTSSNQSTLDKAKQVWRLQEGLEAKNEEGTHLEEATKEDIEPGLLEDTINTMEKEQWR